MFFSKIWTLAKNTCCTPWHFSRTPGWEQRIRHLEETFFTSKNIKKKHFFTVFILGTNLREKVFEKAISAPQQQSTMAARHQSHFRWHDHHNKSVSPGNGFANHRSKEIRCFRHRDWGGRRRCSEQVKKLSKRKQRLWNCDVTELWRHHCWVLSWIMTDIAVPTKHLFAQNFNKEINQ